MAGLNGNNKYWRAVHIVIYPCYYYFERNYCFGLGALRIATFFVDVLIDNSFVLAVKNNEDNNFNVNERNINKLLAENIALLAQFEKEILELENSKKGKEESSFKIEICKRFIVLIDRISQK